jgi:hypothetical protein
VGYLICSLLSKQSPRVDADEASLRNVIKAANTPATICSLEHLKFELQRLLGYSIQTCVVLILCTFTPVATQANIKSHLIQPHPGAFTPIVSQVDMARHSTQTCAGIVHDP